MRAVMDLLNEGGSGPQALMVGGCVRNALLGLPVADVDIATRLTPEDVTERLERAGIRVVPTGIAHGTVTAVVDHKSYEITTLRRDVSTDGRRATVAFTDDWAEDARRRDFTMNTLLMDMDGRVYDPLGMGMADLEARRVVFVGEPAERIAEDYLRVLRFFRFHACYGAGEPDPAALSACAAAADKISTLSRERITQEFVRIVMAGNAVDIILVMIKNNILNDIFNVRYQQEILRRLVDLQQRFVWPGLAARLVVVAGFDPGHLAVMERSLVFSNAVRAETESVAAAALNLNFGLEKQIKELKYKYKTEISTQAILLAAARDGAAADDPALTAAMDLARCWQPPAFPLTGQDLLAAGTPQGPEVGRVLATVEAWWIEHDFTPDRAACLGRAEQVRGGG